MAIAALNDNHLSLINKTLMLKVQIYFNIVNMVLCEVLECHVGCCNHGAMWGVEMPCRIDITSYVLINFILFYSHLLFLFYFIFLKLKYVFKMCKLINVN